MPIIEAFHKGVPVLAYASTAVPATMDGGGVLYDTTDPLEIARLMEAVLDDPALEDAVLQSQDAALSRLLARDFAGTLLRLRRRGYRRPAAPGAGRRVGLLGPVRTVRTLRGAAAVRPALFQALPAPPVSGLGARGSGLGTGGDDQGPRLGKLER